MDLSNLHDNLKCQISQHITNKVLSETPDLLTFIESINQTYIEQDKKIELLEESAKFNEKEFSEINCILKEELDKKVSLQNKLIEAIKQLSGNNKEVNSDNTVFDLIEVLNHEIEIKKESRKKLKQTKKLAEEAHDAKSEFLSIMSHEIRTPLNAIIGLIYIMEKENSLKSFHENVEVMKQSAQVLYLLINDILDFNKIEAGQITLERSPFNLVDLVNQIVKALQVRASENLNTIEVVVDENFEPNLISDPLRINQIITNLVSNAVKFTQNGAVKIKLNQVAIDDNHSTFKVEIIDSGIGINKNEFHTIFQKFSQAETRISRQFGGTGLGLAITKKLLNLLKSDIYFESEIGVGSNFYFTLQLPVNTKFMAINIGDLQNNYKEQKLDGLKVLLVEDNSINIKIAQKILGQWGVEVDSAVNGLVGVEKFKTNKYDVILMDLSMPVMDGYEATTIIRQDDKLIPIIALTASSSFEYLDRALQIGVNEYVVKPFNPKELNMRLIKYYKNKLAYLM